PEQLAAPHAGHGRDMPEGVEAICPHEREEPSELVRRPELDLLGASLAWLRRPGCRGDVPAHQTAVGGVGEQLAERSMDVPDGLRRQAPTGAVAPPATEQIAVEVVEVAGGELLQGH